MEYIPSLWIKHGGLKLSQSTKITYLEVVYLVAERVLQLDNISFVFSNRWSLKSIITNCSNELRTHRELITINHFITQTFTQLSQ